jgi:hypothetical protein
MPTKATKLVEKTRWTSWKRLGTGPYYTRHGTSSPCDATTPEGSGPETSRWAIWCFGCDKTPEGGTSLVIKEGSTLPRQSTTLPQGLKGGNPLCVEIFPRKKIFSARMSFVLFDYFESGS